MSNAEIAYDAGCDGVFLIHMDGNNSRLVPAMREVKDKFPSMKVGLNLLGVNSSFAVTMSIHNGADMTWTDTQVTHTSGTCFPPNLLPVFSSLLTANPTHQMFCGVAFKHQKQEDNPGKAAQDAINVGLIPTTSGAATGESAEVSKLQAIRAAIGRNKPLAIASGITPDNVHEYLPYVSHILVSTGISKDFYTFDFEALYRLVGACNKYHATATTNDT